MTSARSLRLDDFRGLIMFATAKAKLAAAAVLLALVIVPAPLLPPLGLAGMVQSLLGVGWKSAYLATAFGLHIALYGSLGVVAAFAVGPAKRRRHRLLQPVFVSVGVVGIAVLLRSLKLGHLPILANAAVPMAASALGVIAGLLFRQHGWRVTLIALAVLAVGLLWALLPGASEELGRATTAQLLRLVATAPRLPSGEERFGSLLQAVFAPMPSASVHPDPVEHNRAAILALGIAIGHERLARYAGLDRRSELVRATAALQPGTTLRGREDWPRHFFLSAALTVDQFRQHYGGVGSQRYRQQVNAIEARLDRCAALSLPRFGQ